MKKSRRVSVAIAVIVLILLSLGFLNSKYGVNTKLLTRELREVKNIVNKYYENLSDKNYIEALHLIDYNKNSNLRDLDWLNENRNYKISKVENCEYILDIKQDKKMNCYIVNTVFTLSFIEVGIENYRMNERIYVKRTDDNFKIIQINSKDSYVNHRSNLNGDY